MATKPSIFDLLRSLGEGDQFELGTPFLFDPKEPLVWKCEESVEVDTLEGPQTRVVLHVYFRTIMLRAFVVLLEPVKRTLTWVVVP